MLIAAVGAGTGGAWTGALGGDGGWTGLGNADGVVVAECSALTGAWEARRNAARRTMDWRFTTADARIKLKHLYPVVTDDALPLAANDS